MIPIADFGEEFSVVKTTNGGDNMKENEEKQIVHDLKEMLGQVNSEPESSNISTPTTINASESFNIATANTEDFDLEALFGDSEDSNNKKRKFDNTRSDQSNMSQFDFHIPDQDTIRQIKKDMVDKHNLLTSYSALKTSFTHVTKTLKETKEKLNNSEKLKSENDELKQDNQRMKSEYEAEIRRLKQRCGEL